MSNVHPSLILRIDLDSRVASEELFAEIKRCFSYIAMSDIRVHDAPDAEAPVENAVTLAMKLHRPYWDAEDVEAQANWDETVAKWLHNMGDKLATAIRGMNRIREDRGDEAVRFAWIGWELGSNAKVMMAATADSTPDGEAVNRLCVLRELAAQGVLSAGVQVQMPAKANLDEQFEAYAAALEAKAAAEAAATEVADGEAAPGEAAAGNAEAADDEPAEAAEEANLQVSRVLPAPFTVDYRIWSVTAANSAENESRVFDSEIGTYLV